jgi:hypothetical protein
LFTNRR